MNRKHNKFIYILVILGLTLAVLLVMNQKSNSQFYPESEATKTDDKEVVDKKPTISPPQPLTTPRSQPQKTNNTKLPPDLNRFIQQLYAASDNDFFPTLEKINQYKLSSTQKGVAASELIQVYHDAKHNFKAGHMIHIAESLAYYRSPPSLTFVKGRILEGDEDLVIKSALYETAKSIFTKDKFKDLSREFADLLSKTREELVENENNQFIYKELYTEVSNNADR